MVIWLKEYKVYNNIIHGKNMYYITAIDGNDEMIVKEATCYLWHLVNKGLSINTIRMHAKAISFYYGFLDEDKLNLTDVLAMTVAEQYQHISEFLGWLKAGKHSSTNTVPNNNTCNDYLKKVFAYYNFLLMEYEVPALKVLVRRMCTYVGMEGVRFSRSYNAYNGYLPREEHHSKIIRKEELEETINKSTNSRNRLLLLLLAETGFRIGEILGVKYTEDIDFDNRTIRVYYRANNENGAKAKYAEYRRARLSEQTFELLLRYIRENDDVLKETKYLFVCLHGETKGQALTVNAVYSAFRELEKKTDIKITPHMVRHYFADSRRVFGWSIDKISAALGHRHLATTESYLHVVDDELMAAQDEYYAANKDLYLIDKLI